MIRATILHREGAALYCALAAASVMVIVALAQLFAYEKFPSVLATGLPVVASSAQITLLAALLVIFEVAAAANLIDVPLSRLARWCSRAAGFLVPVSWIAIMIAKKSGDSALLGAKIHLSVGGISYGLMVIALLLVVSVAVFDARGRA